MTQKLYDDNSYLKEFKATVLSCEKVDDKFHIILDKTAFFPTSGGQYGDSGYIGNAEILIAEYKDKTESEIIHISNTPITVGEIVDCKINFDKRYTKMQNHTGEHIISGLIHKKYGYDNVGFHLSNDSYFTCDYNGYIDPTELALIEKEVNKIIYEQKIVKTYYPDNIDELEYRSKKELSSKVRIVEIEDVDMCACCAPHVKNTGEVGIFKIIENIKYKGGIRITCVCGFDAYNDYKKRVDLNKELSIMLNSPVFELKDALVDEQNNIIKLKTEISQLKSQIIDLTLNTIDLSSEFVLHFFNNYNMDDIRAFANKVVNVTNKTCIALSENDKGFIFVIISKNINLIALKNKMIESLNCKCGGNNTMITGNISSNKDDIITFFNKEI